MIQKLSFLLIVLSLAACTAAKTSIATPSPTSTPLPSETVGGESIEDLIGKEIATKHQKKLDDVTVDIEKQIGNHASGQVTIKNEKGGSVWFAAKVDNYWKVVYEGQDVISCRIVDQYAFPKSVVSKCFDEKSKATKDR